MLGIFAAGRNGSTLLMRLLDGSPDLWIYPIELRWLEVRQEEGAVEGWAERQIEELERTYLGRLADPLEPAADPLAALRASAGEPPDKRLGAFLDGVREAYAPSTVARDSTHTFKTIEVADPQRYGLLFPELRFVHLVRNPLDNYASLKRTDMLEKGKPFWFQGGDVLQTFVERRWVPHARYMLGAVEREPDRHRIVRYEDVCAEPERIVRELCDWLGAAHPQQPDLQTVLGGRRLRELPNRAPERATADLQRGKEEVVTPREGSLIRLAAGGLAEQLGYDLDGRAPEATRGQLLRSWLPLDKWETMNVDSRRSQAKALLSRRLYVTRKLLRP